MPDFDVQDLIKQEAAKAGIPAQLALSVAEQESGFNPTLINPQAVNGEHATGTFQLLPSTAKTLGITDPNDPLQNIHGGVTYLRQLMDQHQGDIDKVLAQYGGVRTNTTYVPQVRARMSKFASADAPADAAGAGGTPSMPPPAPPPIEPSFWDRVRGTFDWGTDEGRRNFGGAVGGMIGGALAAPTFAVSGPLGPGLGAVVGAGVGGGLAEGVNKWIGHPPPQPPPGSPDEATQSSTLGDMGSAMTGQMTNEMLGQAVMLPIRAVGKAAMAMPVAKNAMEHLTGAFAELDKMLLKSRTPIEPAAAGREFDQMVQGPAKTALNTLGEEVEHTAASGPRLPTQPLKDRLAELSAQVTPLASHGQPPAGALPGAAAPPGTALTAGAPGALAAPLPPDHPLPAVLAKVEAVLNEAGDEIDFADAHKIKRAVNDALNWQSPAKKQAQQMGKGFNQTLRDLMSSHQPYNDATAAYAKTIKLFNSGVAPQLHRGIIDNPEAIVRLVKSNQPTKLQMLRDLVDQAVPNAPQQAERAWDSLRGAWTNTHLVSGDVSKLGERLAKMDPEFSRLMFSGPNGQAQLTNLQAIAGAYEKATANEAAFGASSLSKARSIGEVARDVGHIALPTHPHTKMIAAGRLLLFGAKSRDLVRWAATSPLKTRLVVSALTSPYSGTAIANLLKVWSSDAVDMPVEPPETSPGSSVATGPPPTPPGAQAGTPPPAPPGSDISLTMTSDRR